MLEPPEGQQSFVQFILDDAQDLAEENGMSFASVLINYWIVAQQYLSHADAHAVSMLSQSLSMLMRGEIDDEEFAARLTILSTDLEIAVPILRGQAKRH